MVIVVKSAIMRNTWKTGPTKVVMSYDKWLIEQLGPNLVDRGPEHHSWEVREGAIHVLNRLKQCGYRVVAMTSDTMNFIYLWTLDN